MTAPESMKPDDGKAGGFFRHRLWIPLAYIYLFTLFTFSAPEREGPSSIGSLDVIALVKLAIRISAFFVLGTIIVRSWNHPRRLDLSRMLFPWGLYIGWAIVSAFWSPLKAVSLGQAFGLMVQVMLAYVLALRCADLEGASKVLYHLSMALMAYNAATLTVFSISPELSGLTRVILGETHWGMYHPTAVGAAASLGSVILLGARLLWGWRWTRIWLAPVLLIHAVPLWLAANRMAILLGAVTAMLFLFLFSRRLVASGVIAAVCIAAAGYITFDPGLEMIDRGFGAASTYAIRGETSDQLRTVTGRTDLWEMIWEEVRKSPLIGHGYFVTSEFGELDVWEGPSNKTAHNILLQVLVSTGAIGIGLFIWALIQPLAICGKSLRFDPSNRKLAAFLGLLGIWYFGWGFLNEAFMGPVQPEAVVFFSLLGLACGVFSSAQQTTRI